MTAMHAYGHEWACQLVYNPWIIQGLGLSDDEGTERPWSHFIKLIEIEHSSSVCHAVDLSSWTSTQYICSANVAFGWLTVTLLPLQRKWLMTLVIGSNASSKKVYRSKALLCKPFGSLQAQHLQTSEAMVWSMSGPAIYQSMYVIHLC